MRIAQKLTLALALVVTTVLVVNGYMRVQTQLAMFREDVQRDHYTLAYALALAATVVAERSGPEEAVHFLEDTNVRESRILIRWIPDASLAPQPAGSRAIARRVESQLIEDVNGDLDELVTEVALTLSGDASGYVELRESLTVEQSYVHAAVMRTVIVVLVTILLCAAIIGALGSWLVGRPMRLLVGKLRRVGGGDLGTPLVIRQRDEMGELAQEINAMCNRLRAADERAERETNARIAALEQLRHADRLTTVGKLSSGIAHEIGTPLNVISARAKMIVRGESTGDEIGEDARIIAEQSDRIAHIIRQLLDFARTRKLRKAVEDLRSVARTAVELLAPLGAKKNVTVEVDVPGEPVLAAVDAPQIQQVVANLVVNAIQAQSAGGTVRVRVDRGDPRAPERRPRIVVEDDGPGMPADVRERVFEPFFTTKDVGEGTGLGLSVAYGIVEEHRGRIDVESDVGRGSRFVISLNEPEEAWESRQAES